MNEVFEFESTASMLDSSVYGYHLPVPQKVSDAYKDTDRRVVCTLNNDVKWQCALMPKGDDTYMILLHKGIRKKLNIDLGDTVKISLKKDESEYGMPLPDELLELWSIDPDAHEVFHTLTKGKQRSLIYVIGKPKRSETRAKKAVAIMEYLKMVGGKLDFRELNQFIKNYNAI